MKELSCIFSVFTPFLCAVIIFFIGDRRKNLRDTVTVLASLFSFFFVFQAIDGVRNGLEYEVRLGKLAENVEFYLKVDAMGMVFAALSSFLWILVSLYSIAYLRALDVRKQTRYYYMFATAIGSAIGIAYSGNLVTMYMFYEALTLSTYPLVSHKETAEALKAGRKYLFYLLTGAGFVLFAIIATYHFEGSTDFVPGGFLKETSNPKLLFFVFVSFFIGFGVKAAVMPLHEWLPSAMVAPTPVSALLHAVAVVKAGVFCILRLIFYVFGPELLNTQISYVPFAYFVAFTIVTANILAIYENNLKRRLAFSTINNLSIIILGALLLTPNSVKGAILHMIYHGFMKITLFMCAGAIYVIAKRDRVDELDGVGKELPSTFLAFTIGAIGLMGVPPVCGFLSKWYLCLGAIEKKDLFFLFVFLISSLLDTVYFSPIIFKGFFKKSVHHSGTKEKPSLLVFPLIVTAAFSIVLFLLPNFGFRFYDLSVMVANSVLGGKGG